jgi:4-methylaminobutanoate oxidase (formaldehyde-forming)
VFGAKNGWERPDYYRSGRPWRRAGADQRAYGWTRPPEFDRLAAEHAAFRERVGIIDMTSFGKIEVEGADAAALLDRVCVNRIDRPAGSVVYTQWCDRRGGIVADVTVTRLAADHFRVVTGAGVVDSDLGWLRLHRRDGEAVSLREASDELAVVGMWGPRARDVLAAVTGEDVSASALPFRAARPVAIGAAPVLAQRITYVGELGYELYVAPEWAVQVWDALLAAGAVHGIEPGGYRVLESLRMEKGYRYMGTDISAGDTPYEAGLGFCVALGKGDFIGRDALAEAAQRGSERALRTLVVGGEAYLPLYGGEAVRLGGRTAGRVRSCAYGHTVRRNIAYAYLPAETAAGTPLEVEVLGEPVAAEVAADVLYDPAHERVRG